MRSLLIFSCLLITLASVHSREICQPECPPNSTYDPCGLMPFCYPICHHIRGPPCREGCNPGCFCNPGYLSADPFSAVCILSEDCTWGRERG
ncbi:CLUMA_CG000815, isoform A [Clunio marinus]|uniref:CLUMA_CG000815, isoform A n=1 Tax=Clunio marinus TaxID=568069 RepID=A0A1J1HHG9_9DIPT|nr:CLUMA_CG000815, isoform A [Clunio marinus]